MWMCVHGSTLHDIYKRRRESLVYVIPSIVLLDFRSIYLVLSDQSVLDLVVTHPQIDQLLVSHRFVVHLRQSLLLSPCEQILIFHKLAASIKAERKVGVNVKYQLVVFPCLRFVVPSATIWPFMIGSQSTLIISIGLGDGMWFHSPSIRTREFCVIMLKRRRASNGLENERLCLFALRDASRDQRHSIHDDCVSKELRNLF
mmetsp:Transcript_18029/g.28753  ORF Transcript_18029/g.28753 Transcript_18029/m.28753 type:complete len:201 (-) Transcript_18029:33-635(-)